MKKYIGFIILGLIAVSTILFSTIVGYYWISGQKSRFQKEASQIYEDINKTDSKLVETIKSLLLLNDKNEIQSHLSQKEEELLNSIKSQLANSPNLDEIKSQLMKHLSQDQVNKLNKDLKAELEKLALEYETLVSQKNELKTKKDDLIHLFETHPIAKFLNLDLSFLKEKSKE